MKKSGNKIKLYADEYGAELLKFIGYDDIITIPGLDNESIHFAAQIKFEALKRMDLNDMLIDGDLFVRSPAAFNIIHKLQQENDFVYSFYEPNSFIVSPASHAKYEHLLSTLQKHAGSFSYPYTIDTVDELQWPNTSLMCFSNEDLKAKYITQYEYYKNVLENEEFDDMWPDVIIEQHHIEKLLKHDKFTSACVIEDFPAQQANEYAINIGFTHLGTGKYLHKKWVFILLENIDKPLYDNTIKQIDKYFNQVLLTQNGNTDKASK